MGRRALGGLVVAGSGAFFSAATGAGGAATCLAGGSAVVLPVGSELGAAGPRCSQPAMRNRTANDAKLTQGNRMPRTSLRWRERGKFPSRIVRGQGGARHPGVAHRHFRRVPVVLGTVDRWIPYRFLRSTDLVWSKALAENPSLERLPVVVPIVLTHARERWWAPMQLQDLVGDRGQLPSCLRDKVPQQSYFLFDLRGMTDSQIVSMATTASLRLLLLILRNVRNPELGAMLRAWHELLGSVVREPSGLRVMELLLTYLAKAVPTMTQETLMQVGQMAGMDPELVEGSLAWRWLEEGREEGREMARRLVLRLLAKRFGPVPSWVEERVASSSIEHLDGWSERMLEAASLEEVFG